MKKIALSFLISMSFLGCGLQVRDNPTTATITGSSSNTDGSGTFTVGGTASGIPYKKDVVVTVNGQSFTIDQNGSFTFTQNFEFNSTYDVAVSQGPGGAYACTLQNASGTVRGNVTNVTLTCTCDVGSLGTGAGTLADPAIVYTATQLNDLGVSGTTAQLKKVYKQACDLDYTGIAPTPIGDSISPFKGKYDGGDFFILHYHSDETTLSKDHRKGIFGYIVGGWIRNIGVSDVVITAETGMATGTAGYMGSIAGTIYDASIEYAYIENVTLNDHDEHLDGIGGVVGNQLASSLGSCPCCLSHLNFIHIENVTIEGGSSENVGGVAGWTQGNTKQVEVENVTINACINHCGGVVGATYNEGNFQNLNVQNVTVKGNEKTGGIAGENTGTITRSAFVGTIDGQTTTGGFGGLVGFSDSTHKLKHSYTVSDIFSPVGSSMVGSAYGNFADASDLTFDSAQVCQNCSANAGTTGITSLDVLFTGSDSSMSNWDFSTVWCKQGNDFPRLIEVPYSSCQ